MSESKKAIVAFVDPPTVVEHGTLLKLPVRVTTEQGDERRPDTLRLKVLPPSGVMEVVEEGMWLVRSASGGVLTLKVDQAGRWKVRAEAEGRLVGAGEISFRVKGSAFYG